MSEGIEVKEEATVLFAGDSGDGMQLTGTQFTNTNALFGNDVSTFPNFPAEIRAPQGTIGGVSGFQVKFGSQKIYTPGDLADVLVVMNAAALKANIHKLTKGGVVIANKGGFDSKNLKLAGLEGQNPLESPELESCIVYEIDITSLTIEALVDLEVPKKDAVRSKNMFVLGFLYWMFGRSLDATFDFVETKFAKNPQLIEINKKVLKAGYYYGETAETFTTRYQVSAAKLPSGVYRSILGNEGVALGLIAASKKANLDLFFGSYPITPASDILHELVKHKNFGVKTYQAEDEIAAITAAIGASFGGALGTTASSGPGIALKGEALGLAVMLEIPLVVVNVQRGGPSTGLPTKTEQADLMQALYGRNGEAPIPTLAISHPSEAFMMTYEAVKLAVEHMTPVMLLSDGYIANGAEPWRFPTAESLPTICPKIKTEKTEEVFYPYKRDGRLVREWALPGTKDLQHRIGGLEKEALTGNVSYDSANHEKMVHTRAEKVELIADVIPTQELDAGKTGGKVLVLGWGSTYGAIKTAVGQLLEEGKAVAHLHLKYLNPLPKGLVDLMESFDQILVPEMNNGQLDHYLKAKTGLKMIPFNKIQGIPFTAKEVKEKVRSLIEE